MTIDTTQLPRNHPVLHVMVRHAELNWVSMIIAHFLDLSCEHPAVYVGCVPMLSFKFNLLDGDVAPISLRHDEGEVEGEEEGD